MSHSASSSISTPLSASGSSLPGQQSNGNEVGDEKNRSVRPSLSIFFSPPLIWFFCFLCSVVIKVGMVGDSQIGKTSLMVKYVEGSFDEDYIQTLGAFDSILEHLPLLNSNRCFTNAGVNFMEKTISVRRTTITFSIWDLGGQREFVNMLPLVCNDAVAILFMFDLSRKSTLNSVKEWYRQARGFNKVCGDLFPSPGPA